MDLRQFDLTVTSPLNHFVQEKPNLDQRPLLGNMPEAPAFPLKQDFPQLLAKVQEEQGSPLQVGSLLDCNVSGNASHDPTAWKPCVVTALKYDEAGQAIAVQVDVKHGYFMSSKEAADMLRPPRGPPAFYKAYTDLGHKYLPPELIPPELLPPGVTGPVYCPRGSFEFATRTTYGHGDVAATAPVAGGGKGGKGYLQFVPPNLHLPGVTGPVYFADSTSTVYGGAATYARPAPPATFARPPFLGSNGGKGGFDQGFGGQKGCGGGLGGQPGFGGQPAFGGQQGCGGGFGGQPGFGGAPGPAGAPGPRPKTSPVTTRQVAPKRQVAIALKRGGTDDLD